MREKSCVLRDGSECVGTNNEDWECNRRCPFYKSDKEYYRHEGRIYPIESKKRKVRIIHRDSRSVSYGWKEEKE